MFIMCGIIVNTEPVTHGPYTGSLVTEESKSILQSSRTRDPVYGPCPEGPAFKSQSGPEFLSVTQHVYR